MGCSWTMIKMKDLYNFSRQKVYSSGKGRVISGDDSHKDLAVINLRRILAYGSTSKRLVALPSEQRDQLGKVMKGMLGNDQDYLKLSLDSFYSTCLQYGINADQIRAFWCEEPKGPFRNLTRMADIALGCYDNSRWKGFLTFAENLIIEQREKEANRFILRRDGTKKFIGVINKPEQLELMF